MSQALKTAVPTLPGTSVPDPAKLDSAIDPSRRWTSAVAVTAAVLAACAAISSMLSNGHITQAMLEQIEASNQWNYFQAKGVKRSVLESKLEMLTATGQPITKSDEERVARYQREQDEIAGEAKRHQDAAQDHRRRFRVMSQAGAVFQIAIALSAIALLVKRNWFWFGALGVGTVGLGLFTWGLWPLA
jgi:hypothetical protein